MPYKFTTFVLINFLFLSCAVVESPATDISGERISDLVKTLASDEFEGRAPGGVGEDKTVAFLIEQFQSIGLEPGGENGNWTQNVPLIHTQIQG